MEAAFVGDLFRDALWLVVLAVAILIVPSLLVGLMIATFQAATQINEQTLSFLPRLIVTLLMCIVAGPYLVSRLLDYFQGIFLNLHQYLG